MPTYTTLPIGADIMQNKTTAFVIINISDDVDLGYWWYKSGGSPDGRLRVTLTKPNGTTVEKLASADVTIVNTQPQSIKVLLLPTDLDFVGILKFFPEFKIDDSWVTSDPVSMNVVDDPIPTA